MADEATTSNTADTEAEKTEADATPALGDAGKKALDAERREKRAAEKRAADLEARLKEFEDRDKSETQRLGEAADAYQKRALEAEIQVLRLQVAAERGLTPAQAKRLVGSSLEELEADADELLETFKPAEVKAAEKETQNVAAALDLGNRGAPAPTSDQDAANWLQNLTRK